MFASAHDMDFDWRYFLRQRASDIGGAAAILAAIFIALSLATYDSFDPSFNTASSQRIQNWGGVPGAYIADLALQLFGLCSVMIAITPLVWGSRLIFTRRIDWFWLKFSLMLFLLPCLAAAFASIPTPSWYPIKSGLGGYIGLFTYKSLAAFMPAVLSFAIFFIVSMVLMSFCFDISIYAWKAMGGAVISASVIAFQYLADLKERIFQPSGEKAEDGEEEEYEEDDEEEEEIEEERSEQRKKKFLKKRRDEETEIEKPAPAKKKSKKGAQASLKFEEERIEYELPPVDLLAVASARSRKAAPSESALNKNARLLESVLEDFGVYGRITKIRPGPVVTLYELEPSPGTKSSRVIGLADDIARSMSAVSARIAVIPGRNAIGIELPNSSRETVLLRELLESDEYSGGDQKLSLVLGKDIGGAPIIVDLAKMPHLLVAGTTGSGKSVGINAMILSLLYKMTPDQCKFIMIDPKMLELSVYDGIPHLLAPVVTEPGKAVVALKWTVKEMENRYRLMSTLGVRNIAGYNQRIEEAAANGEALTRNVQTGFDPDTGKPIIEETPLDMNPLPYIVVIVDEMADLMLVAGKDIEASIQRLAQMARAAGIHLIMATQRPSVDVITGVIKANFPTRISFQVTSKIDSRTILGDQGAEQLLGQGDMLYMAGGGRITRVHGPFVKDQEVEQIATFLRSQGEPEYVAEVTEEEDESLDAEDMESSGDELYDKAVSIVLADRKASTSYIQRRLKIGYNRAASIMEEMEKQGVISPANHVGKREILAG